jgi:hypothetical protein
MVMPRVHLGAAVEVMPHTDVGHHVQTMGRRPLKYFLLHKSFNVVECKY